MTILFYASLCSLIPLDASAYEGSNPSSGSEDNRIGPPFPKEPERFLDFDRSVSASDDVFATLLKPLNADWARVWPRPRTDFACDDCDVERRRRLLWKAVGPCDRGNDVDWGEATHVPRAASSRASSAVSDSIGTGA